MNEDERPANKQPLAPASAEARILRRRTKFALLRPAAGERLAIYRVTSPPRTRNSTVLPIRIPVGGARSFGALIAHTEGVTLRL
jgi:hypothetical protein